MHGWTRFFAVVRQNITWRPCVLSQSMTSITHPKVRLALSLPVLVAKADAVGRARQIITMFKHFERLFCIFPTDSHVATRLGTTVG